MKDDYRTISLARFCRLLGVTRQAYYQFFWQAQEQTTEMLLIVEHVRRIRREHPVMGGRKLYCMLQPFLLEHQIKVGRDALFDILWENNLLIRRKRRKAITTNSCHWFKKYPNLLKQWQPELPGQLWVADITYVRHRESFFYLSLITDAYSHKIMGYYLGDTLEAVHSVSALQMAVAQLGPAQEVMHHSDRGIQYCCQQYVNILKENNLRISMTETGDPLENPIAERINGIIKNEYLDHYNIETLAQARSILDETVSKYNNARPHQSIGLLTPEFVHQNNLAVNKKWSKKNKSVTL